MVGREGACAAMMSYAKTLQKDTHTRRYEIVIEAAGWRVIEHADSEVVRAAVYTDWHRVERARRAFDIEMSSLRNEGWTERR
jgi:hypothetical protein